MPPSDMGGVPLELPLDPPSLEPLLDPPPLELPLELPELLLEPVLVQSHPEDRHSHAV